MFIDEGAIFGLLNGRGNNQKEDISRILDKALLLKGLELVDVAALLKISDEESLRLLFSTASKIKESIYGNRLVLFAPLYVSNFCSNNCLYCGFRKGNTDMDRKCLSVDDFKDEVRVILEQGHKRVLMLMGEDDSVCSFDYFLELLKTAYSVKDLRGNLLRRINVEIAPLTDEQFQVLSKIKIGTYTVFQETYHKDTYDKMHPSGIKSDYMWRLNVMDRALSNGLHDVGIGVLFGLFDYKFEVLALLSHATHLDEVFGVGPHTISVPRIEPAQNAPAAMHVPNPVSDKDFKKIVAILRCAVPYTGIILSTRESPMMREELFGLGVSQISAGSKANPGGYKELLTNSSGGQFCLNDTRSTDEIISSVIKQGFVPSFCTGCYRKGRVGKDFMDLAKPGLIKLHCLPNALLTLQEYLVDYGDEETIKLGEILIKKELENIPDLDRREKTRSYIDRIYDGERDLYF